MATYGPGIDQSLHTKSVSHIIIELMICGTYVFFFKKTRPLFVHV